MPLTDEQIIDRMTDVLRKGWGGGANTAGWNDEDWRRNGEWFVGPVRQLIAKAGLAQPVDLPVMLCGHGAVLCARCDFIPPSWKPQL